MEVVYLVRCVRQGDDDLNRLTIAGQFVIREYVQRNPDADRVSEVACGACETLLVVNDPY